MEIKRCTIQDIPQLISIATQSYLEHYTYLWHDKGESYIKANFNYSTFAEQLKDSNTRLFIIYRENGPAGFFKINLDKGISNYPAYAAIELERLYILQKAAGQGLGKAAISFIISFAKDHKKTILWLKAMTSSKATVFYEQQGFVVYDETVLQLPGIKTEFAGMWVMVREVG